SATLTDSIWLLDESGPLRARVRMENRLGASRLRWTIDLLRDAPRLTLNLDINFAERFTLLQLPIHLADTPRARTDAVAGGVVQRALSPVEWPVQGWSRLACANAELA